jgi:hypothetical protein
LKLQNNNNDDDLNDNQQLESQDSIDEKGDSIVFV